MIQIDCVGKAVNFETRTFKVGGIPKTQKAQFLKHVQDAFMKISETKFQNTQWVTFVLEKRFRSSNIGKLRQRGALLFNHPPPP